MRIRLFALGLTIGAAILAQSPKGAEAQPAFDAVSVKIDNGDFVPGVTGRYRGGPGTSDPGRFSCTQQSMKFLTAMAYGVTFDQLIGPAWFNDVSGDKFTVIATMPPITTKDQFRLMLQNLLKERFGLVLHHESRDFPGYDLLIARGGPKLREWTPSPNAVAAPPAIGRHDESGFPILRPGERGSALGIAMRFASDGVSMKPSRTIRSTHRQSMEEFGKEVGGFIRTANGSSDRPAPQVIDKTGLTGVYEFRLEFTASTLSPSQVGPDVEPVAADPKDTELNFFAALEKQLGLRVVRSKNMPVDVLVIDRVERVPTAN